MLNSFKLSLQYILPKLWLTRLAGWGASKRAGWLTKLVIDLFVKYYKVDMTEAQKPDTASYRTFNDFFVRPLRDDVRPLNTDPNILVMPADGVISQLGRIEEDKILQAKGHNYSLEALLAGNYLMADKFRNGTFVTTYLSPRDYHRVHMPCNGILREMIYVPGDLFSVNHLTAQNVPNLFARNERVICLLIPSSALWRRFWSAQLLSAVSKLSGRGPLPRRAKASSSAGPGQKANMKGLSPC